MCGNKVSKHNNVKCKKSPDETLHAYQGKGVMLMPNTLFPPQCECTPDMYQEETPVNCSLNLTIVNRGEFGNSSSATSKTQTSHYEDMLQTYQKQLVSLQTQNNYLLERLLTQQKEQLISNTPTGYPHAGGTEEIQQLWPSTSGTHSEYSEYSQRQELFPNQDTKKEHAPLLYEHVAHGIKITLSESSMSDRWGTTQTKNPSTVTSSTVVASPKIVQLNISRYNMEDSQNHGNSKNVALEGNDQKKNIPPEAGSPPVPQINLNISVTPYSQFTPISASENQTITQSPVYLCETPSDGLQTQSKSLMGIESRGVVQAPPRGKSNSKHNWRRSLNKMKANKEKELKRVQEEPRENEFPDRKPRRTLLEVLRERIDQKHNLENSPSK